MNIIKFWIYLKFSDLYLKLIFKKSSFLSSIIKAYDFFYLFTYFFLFTKKKSSNIVKDFKVKLSSKYIFKKCIIFSDILRELNLFIRERKGISVKKLFYSSQDECSSRNFGNLKTPQLTFLA